MAAAIDPPARVPPQVEAVELGPRDGLRNEPGTVPTGTDPDAVVAAGRVIRHHLGRPPASGITRARLPDG